ncbi:MAG: type III-B CRISPR module RAMP protein Cmr4 [Lentisphaerae bacterium]|nr:type III-B CRISPR module RAMP protein Cmr4 [Lentisphaerota bacterium]
MNKMIMTLFARTPVHVGAGNSVGAVDSPIQRERHTRIPIIPGSSLKGVLADLWNGELENKTRVSGSDIRALFGSDESKNAEAGALLVGEARVLAFPVRSAKGSFAWITSPLALQRYARDCGEKVPEDIDFSKLDENSCLAAKAVKLDEFVVLEEYRFASIGESVIIADWLKDLVSDPVWKEMPDRLVVLSNEMFSYFCEQSCEVVSRIRIDDVKGTVAKGALFNQEQVPSETLFYSVCFIDERRCADTVSKVKDKLSSVGGILQVGGDASTGLGYCSVEVK